MGRPKKQTTAPEPKPSGAGTDQLNDLTALKDRLRAKYHDLRGDLLDFDSREDLINYVCRVLGMHKPELEAVIEGFHLP